MRVLLAVNHVRMPWKNGGGETVEVAITPANASREDFARRGSVPKYPPLVRSRRFRPWTADLLSSMGNDSACKRSA